MIPCQINIENVWFEGNLAKYTDDPHRYVMFAPYPFTKWLKTLYNQTINCEILLIETKTTLHVKAQFVSISSTTCWLKIL